MWPDGTDSGKGRETTKTIKYPPLEDTEVCSKMCVLMTEGSGDTRN